MNDEHIYVLINNERELQQFRFFYLNIWNIDVTKDQMKFYFNGRYNVPCLVALKEWNHQLKFHQGVKNKGDSWRDYLNSLPPSDKYNQIKTWSLKTLFQKYD